jgi:hypothetical protein
VDLLAAKDQRHFAMAKLPTLPAPGVHSPFQTSGAMPSVAGVALMPAEYGDVTSLYAPKDLVPLQASIHVLQPFAHPLIL